MTTGLNWYLHYRRGTGNLSQIIVMDQTDDQWLQDPVFKRSGEARPGESAPTLIQRYRAEMIRRTEANPAQAGKPSEISPLPSNHCVNFSGSFPVMGWAMQKPPTAWLWKFYRVRKIRRNGPPPRKGSETHLRNKAMPKPERNKSGSGRKPKNVISPPWKDRTPSLRETPPLRRNSADLRSPGGS